MKKIMILIVFLGAFLGFSQKKHSLQLGNTTKEELELTVYDKDSTANAVVLEEYGNVYIDEYNDYYFRTDYYKRIKFFNKNNDSEEKATVSVRLYKKNKIEEIKAVTYALNGNKIKKVSLLENQIFTKQITEDLKEVTFTLPNITKGCVIEYSYSVINYSTDLRDWYFQSDIPKIKSGYRASIPGNWKYKTRVIGFENLDKDEFFVKKNCLKIPGFVNVGDCLVTEYEMNHVPAFKEEDYMLAKKNFISHLAFELESFTESNGVVQKYTKTWKNTDKTIKNLLFDKQTSKKKYFKNNLSKEFLGIKDPLEKAKAIYYHIQERMHWNEDYWRSKKLKVKRVYETKIGSAEAINLTLYNALQAFDIESYMVVLSTRNNGIPTKLHPTVECFNYAIVKVVINGEAFFLDATDKFLPFGEVPKRCLNGEARILDFRKGSYWETIKPRFKTSLRTQSQLEFNELGELTGTLIVQPKGYFLIEEKRKIKNNTEDNYLDDFESDHPNIEVNEIAFKGLKDIEGNLKVIYNVNIDVDKNENRLAINPFFYVHNKENPFKLKQRNYPVDFASPIQITNIISLKIPEGYKVSSIPNVVGFSLPLKGGEYVFNTKEIQNTINIISKLNINKKIFSSQEYYYLKEFFNQIIKAQESLIILEKK